MTTEMPILTTGRLLIRTFLMNDLERVYQIMDVEFSDDQNPFDETKVRQERKDWLSWSIANHVQLGEMYQPPYGEKAITLRDSGEVIGACGLVPCLGPYGLLPALASGPADRAHFSTAEVGLYYAVAREHRGRGYATEAASAFIEYAFGTLRLGRIIATTTYDNGRSMAVMRRLGMTIDRNPFPEPPWLQVVGVLENE
jgi:RimJ/RimL family protein N-acetyltransferase